MSYAPKVILLEFNELCPSFLSDFMGRGLLPNFKSLYEGSTIYITDADEDPPDLEPWIQWFTVHSGLQYDEHKVYHLGDGRKFEGKLLADLLSDAGVRVGIFGSMNTNYEKVNGYFIPDPWDTKAAAHPSWLGPFYDTVAKQVQESSREDSFTKADMAKFGMFLAKNGLRMSTAWDAAKQILEEKKTNGGVHWRRACTLEHVSYDLFRQLNKKFDVQFATFFANSTAHFQHYYWRNMDPDRFHIPPSEKDHPSLQTAIQYGYESMDQLIGKVLADYPGSTVILATALSQQPWDTKKCTFRPKTFEDLLTFAGVTDSYEIKPVMAEQFHVVFEDDAAAKRNADKLSAMSVEGSDKLMSVRLEDNQLFSGCSITEYGYLDKPVTNASGDQKRFDELFYMIHGLRSGRHHCDGAFWVRNGSHRVVEQKIPLVHVAPAILNEFKAPVPDFMTAAEADLHRLEDSPVMA